MSRALILAAMLMSGACHAGGTLHGDSMDFTGDKRAHFKASFALGAAVYAADKGLDLQLRTSTKFAIAMAPMVLKEARDASAPGKGWSWQDMAYNAMGVGVGLIAADLVHGLFIAPASGGVFVAYRTEF